MNEKPLPPKIEKRLADLAQMGEFDQSDLDHCRRTYWSAREDWHKILVDCHDAALRRLQRLGENAAPASPAAQHQRRALAEAAA